MNERSQSDLCCGPEDVLHQTLSVCVCVCRLNEHNSDWITAFSTVDSSCSVIYRVGLCAVVCFALPVCLLRAASWKCLNFVCSVQRLISRPIRPAALINGWCIVGLLAYLPVCLWERAVSFPRSVRNRWCVWSFVLGLLCLLRIMGWLPTGFFFFCCFFWPGSQWHESFFAQSAKKERAR